MTTPTAASPGPAQAPSPALWVERVGDTLEAGARLVLTVSDGA